MIRFSMLADVMYGSCNDSYLYVCERLWFPKLGRIDLLFRASVEFLALLAHHSPNDLDENYMLVSSACFDRLC